MATGLRSGRLQRAFFLTYPVVLKLLNKYVNISPNHPIELDAIILAFSHSNIYKAKPRLREIKNAQ
jgi:hypothetical protein